MSTRSNIGVKLADGSVEFIYCHFDGYPQHHVPILTACYSTEDKARALVAPGDMSSLAESIGEKHDFDARPRGLCNYYGRDRGEPRTEMQVASSVVEYERAAQHAYAYLFMDGQWWGRDGRSEPWMPATALLEKHMREEADS